MGSALGSSKRKARRLCSETSQSDTRKDQLMDSPQCRGQGLGVELGKQTLGLVESPDQEEAPHLKVPGVRSVHSVAMLF
jgi:hypothetical protein